MSRKRKLETLPPFPLDYYSGPSGSKISFDSDSLDSSDVDTLMDTKLDWCEKMKNDVSSLFAIIKKANLRTTDLTEPLSELLLIWRQLRNLGKDDAAKMGDYMVTLEFIQVLTKFFKRGIQRALTSNFKLEENVLRFLDLIWNLTDTSKKVCESVVSNDLHTKLIENLRAISEKRLRIRPCEQDLVFLSFSILYNTLRNFPDSKAKFRKTGVIDICSKLLSTEQPRIKTLALFVLTFAADLDAVEVIQASESDLRFLIRCLKKALGSPDKVEDEGFHLEEILESMSRLAMKKTNAVKMVKLNVLQHCLTVLVEKKYTAEEVKWALKLIWSLSFADENQGDIHSSGIVPLLENKFENYENPELSWPAKNILWLLKAKKPDFALIDPKIDGKEIFDEQFIVMMKYIKFNSDDYVDAPTPPQLATKSEPNITTFKCWTVSETSDWLKNLELTNEATLILSAQVWDGELLFQLRGWQKTAPELFLGYCHNVLKIQDPTDLIKFNDAIENLETRGAYDVRNIRPRTYRQEEETPLRGNLHKLTIQQQRAHQIRIQPDKAIQGELIVIDFPEMSVLGERHLGVEIIDLENSIVQNLLKKSKPHITILTDVVQISQPFHVSFLKPVTMKLPLHAKHKDWKKLSKSLERTDKHGRHIKIENGVAEISSFIFSPVCVYYDEIKKAVAALELGDEIDKMLHETGVYLVVEQLTGPQNPAVLNVSFRPFFHFQEHERCRAARNVFFSQILTLEPDAQLIDTPVFKLKWDANFMTSYNQFLEQDLEFKSGFIDRREDWSGKKRLEYLFANPVNDGFVSKNLNVKFKKDERNFTLKSSEELRELEEASRVFIPSQGDLFAYLRSFRQSWLAFMQDCMKIDKMSFREFILKDLKEENEAKGSIVTEEFINGMFTYHTQNGSIEKLKSSVFGESAAADQLTEDNLYKLAEALRYVEGAKLKNALYAGLTKFASEQKILKKTSDEFQNWLWDGTPPENYTESEDLEDAC